jgi:isochorismate pyruvate lyase
MRPPLHRDAGSIAKARDYPKVGEESSEVPLLDRRAHGRYRADMTDPKLSEIKMPLACETMADVRAGVDQVDRELVALLVRRFGYMDAAARIKPDRSAVRDEARKAQVIDNVGREAAGLGLEEDRVRAVWDELVEQSIAYELSRWDATRT